MDFFPVVLALLISIVILYIIAYGIYVVVKAILTKGNAINQNKKKGSDNKNDNAKIPKRWMKGNGTGWLTGAIMILPNGSYRMKVDGYVTSKELLEVHNLSYALTDRFFSQPDQIAIFDNDEGFCKLFSKQTVDNVMNSEEFKEEWNKVENKRINAQKKQAKRLEILAQKRKQDLQDIAERKVTYGGALYEVECEYSYGLVTLDVYAKTPEHAKEVVSKWLKSMEAKKIVNQIYEAAIDSFDDAYDEYIQEERGIEKLYRPKKPKKNDFKFFLCSISKSDKDSSEIDVEEVNYREDGDRWKWDIYSGYI